MEDRLTVDVLEVWLRLSSIFTAVEIEIGLVVGDGALRYGRVEAPGQKIELMVLLLLFKGTPVGGGR
jgi:hypothetical protein